MRNLSLSASIFCFVLVLQLSYSQQGWVQQTSGTNLNLNCIYFVNSNTGYIGADSGRVLKTTNGGNIWITYNTGIQSSVYSVQFPNSLTGFAGTVNNKTIRTNNGGINWDTSGTRGGRSVSFVNTDTGFSSRAYPNAIYRTTNSGASWDSAGYFYTLNPPNKILFLNYSTGYAIGLDWDLHNFYFTFIGKTTNAGQTWTFPHYSGVLPSGGMYDICFPNNNTGFAVGSQYNPILFKSTNGGQNWSLNSLPQTMFSVIFTDTSNGWLCGSGGSILFSSNGGTNWSNQISGVTSSLKQIFMLNQNTGWICGANGTILYTNNGGLTGLEPMNNTLPVVFSLYQNYPNPFNPTTKIHFDLPKNSFTKIVVYDVLGRELETIVNEQLNAGSYTANWNASNYPSGVYFYKLTSGDYSATKKMVLIK